MRRYGLDELHVGALGSIAAATHVEAANADVLWAGRRAYFFKPFGGHASKGVYRGDKMTKSVWAEIMRGGYIAQKFAAPGERSVLVNGVREKRKLDIRLYIYDGALLFAAARIYQGQTTNFRTPGGGFAPVFVV